MRKLLLGLWVSAGLVACGSTSPVDFCSEFETETCARIFECYDDTMKADPGFMATFGSSAAECATKLKANNCTSVTNDHPCPDGTVKYHADKADACISDLKATSCTTIQGGVFNSDNCTAVCS